MPKNNLRIRSSSESDPCLWMQAGMVRRKICRLDYECVSCGFDKAMRRVSEENRRLKEAGKVPRGKRGRIDFWKNKMLEMPPSKRPCAHSMKKRIGFRMCNNDYHCGNCEFDQYFQDQYSVHAVIKPVAVLSIEGIHIPQGFYIHEGHTWAKVEADGYVRIGLDDFALRLLGPLNTIDAPLMGKEIKQGGADFSTGRGDHTAKFLSPVSGVITDMNPKLKTRGSLANQSPYTEGWVVRAHAGNLRRELKNLMIGEEAKAFVQKEIERLHEVIEEASGPLAADGGFLGNDVYGAMPEIGWGKLTKLFLRT